MYICKKNTSGIVPGFAEVDSSGGYHIRVLEGDVYLHDTFP